MSSLYDVSRNELQGAIAQLKEALYNHQQWHSALIRTLVTNLPSNRHDVSSDAHMECRFGQWYYSDAPLKLRQHPGFVALGEEHKRMHHMAGLMLSSAAAGKTISTLDYDNFANALERLRLEIAALERELEDSLFNHDALTGALTRFGILPMLREQQEQVRRHIQSCYIAMVDLDNFKAINDLHGHHAGDVVLTQSAHYLIKNLRPYDKVFRYGGEEFLLCMPYVESDLGLQRIKALADGLAALSIDIGEREPIHISASVGLVLLDPNVSVETSIDRADKAMYAAKAAGRNCVRVWDPAM